MNIDFENALTFVSKDPHWGNKLLAGGGLMLLAYAVLIFPVLFCIFVGSMIQSTFALGLTFLVLFAISSVICMLCQCAVIGYGCEFAHNLIEKKEEILPNWKSFRHLMFVGFKYSLGAFLFLSPILVLYIIGFISMLGAGFLADTSVGLTVMAFSMLLVLLLIGIGILVYFFIIAFLPLMSANFMKEMRISSFVNFKQGFALLKGHGVDYLIFYLVYLAFCCIVGTVATILFFTVIGILFIPILYFYVFLVYSHLSAQFVNLSEKKVETITQVQE